MYTLIETSLTFPGLKKDCFSDCAKPTWNALPWQPQKLCISMETQHKSGGGLSSCTTPWQQGIASNIAETCSVILHMTTKINVISKISLRGQRKQWGYL